MVSVMASIDHILSCFNGVKDTGKGQYVALCPNHDDKHPSLYIKDAGNKVLLDCKAACPTGDVLSAAGLSMRDLFTDSRIQNYKPKQRFNTFEEKIVLLMAEAALGRNDPIHPTDLQRIKTAISRLKGSYDKKGRARALKVQGLL